MFETRAAARDALVQHFDPLLIDAMIAALIPAIVLSPVPEETAARLGGTRLGGTPDLPRGLDWPRPPAPADPEAIAERGNPEAGAMMRRHMSLGLPYSFIAQIDLEEAAALGRVASPLPAEGRLLFFYDQVVGPWESGTRAARVLWDRTPRARLAPSSMPADLADAIVRERQELEASFAAMSLQLPARPNSAYAAPPRAAALTLAYRLPDPHSLEIAALPALAEPHGARDEDLFDAYREFLNEHDSFDHDGWRRQQLLGSPMCEQDDPRLEAVAVTDYGDRHLPSEVWDQHGAEIDAEARAWSLLLQIDFADLTQADFVEGSVYFLIRVDDLAGRRFEAVVAVYQQT